MEQIITVDVQIKMERVLGNRFYDIYHPFTRSTGCLPMVRIIGKGRLKDVKYTLFTNKLYVGVVENYIIDYTSGWIYHDGNKLISFSGDLKFIKRKKDLIVATFSSSTKAYLLCVIEGKAKVLLSAVDIRKSRGKVRMRWEGMTRDGLLEMEDFLKLVIGGVSDMRAYQMEANEFY